MFKHLQLNYDDKGYIGEIQNYWKLHWGKPINPVWHLALSEVTGKKDVRFIPDDIWREEIFPVLNSRRISPCYNDKNLSDILFGGIKQPMTVVKNINGYFYDDKNKQIPADVAQSNVLSGPAYQVIKPSQSNSGYGIRTLDTVGGKTYLDGKEKSWAEIDKLYDDNYIVQERITQHAVMAEPHPFSVNTVRLVTIKWAGEVDVLLAFARFGRNKAINDNAGTGGICCGIDNNGRLYDNAVDEAGNLYPEHPNTGFSFESKQTYIPGYEKICTAGIELHKNLLHFHIASWDFAVDAQGEPILLEVNFRGASWIYQFAARRPLFADLTEDVLAYVRGKEQK